MKTLNELIEAGEKHKKTNKKAFLIVVSIFILALLVTLFTDGTLRWVFLAITVIFTGLTGLAIKQHFTLISHDKKLREALPYAEKEQFEKKVIEMKDITNKLTKESKTEDIVDALEIVEEYKILLEERVRPLLKKGENKLNYDEKIIYTLNQKALLEVRPLVIKLENILLMNTGYEDEANQVIV